MTAGPACHPRCLQGLGIGEILEAVVERVPPPADHRDRELRALIFDSYYDPYKVGGRGDRAGGAGQEGKEGREGRPAAGLPNWPSKLRRGS